VDQIDPIQPQQQTNEDNSQLVKATVSGIWFQKKLMEGLKAELRKVDSKINTMLEVVDNYSIQQKQHQIEQIWSEWRDSVQKVVMQVIGKKSVNGKCKAWWDEEVKNAILELRAFYEQTMSDGTGESWKQYRNQRKHTKWLCKQKKSLAWQNLAKKTKKACKDSDLKLFWNLVNRMGRRQKKINSPISVYKNSGDEVAHSIKESLSVWKDYFFQLGNPDENSNGFDNVWKLEVERDSENHNFPPGDLNSLLTANNNQPHQLNTARRHVNKPIVELCILHLIQFWMICVWIKHTKFRTR